MTDDGRKEGETKVSRALEALDFLISRTIPLRSGTSLVARKQNGAVNAIRAALAPPKGDGWISVKDRLPKQAKWVLGFGGWDKPYLAMWSGNDSEGPTWWGSNQNFHGRVTHWMPLPEPPSQPAPEPKETRRRCKKCGQLCERWQIDASGKHHMIGWGETFRRCGPVEPEGREPGGVAGTTKPTKEGGS